MIDTGYTAGSNFDGTHTDKRCKLQCTTERNWFYGGDASGWSGRVWHGIGRIPLNNFSRRRLCLLYSRCTNCFLSTTRFRSV